PCRTTRMAISRKITTSASKAIRNGPIATFSRMLPEGMVVCVRDGASESDNDGSTRDCHASAAALGCGRTSFGTGRIFDEQARLVGGVRRAGSFERACGGAKRSCAGHAGGPAAGAQSIPRAEERRVGEGG